MAAAGAGSPSMDAALDERDLEPRTPMKRLGSTRKLAAFTNIRVQLSEQTRVLEARAEAVAGVAGELHDYCRRRADLEHEYARALDKLVRAAHQRHKDQKHKREQWPLTGAHACWQAALESSRALARDHAALAELYAGPLAARLQRAADDVLRLHRKCKDIVSERQEEVGGALAEAGAGGKAHAAAAADWRAAALKLRHAHAQRAALLAADPPRHKKLKALDKDLEKRRSRHSEARARALRARADYVLSLEAANATLQRYYLDDIADIIMCTEVGFEAVVGRVARCAGGAERARGAACAAAASALLAAADALDAAADRDRFLAAHPAAFAPPRPLAPAADPPADLERAMRDLVQDAAPDRDDASDAAARDLAARLAQLEAAARALRAECREHAKTLDAAEAELLRQLEGSDAHWDVSQLFGAPAASAASAASAATAAPSAAAALSPPPEDDASRRDQEDYYLTKFRSYVSCAGRLARLESKASAARALCGAAAAAPGGAQAGPAPGPREGAGEEPLRRGARRRGQFAAPLHDRLPLVLTSCVRVIATYGLRHQGVFRVSGSQVEMQALRAAFERGEDPLAEVRDASDINSVCGVLKMFLRELRPPLLAPALQERLVRVAALRDDGAFVRRLRALLAAEPLPALLVLRYLFAFLAHLADHADHNMMDAWNLAICLGPTLLAAWGEGGAQVAQQNLVNELVKRAILHHRDIFPQHVAPHALYRRDDPGLQRVHLDDGAPQDDRDHALNHNSNSNSNHDDHSNHNEAEEETSGAQRTGEDYGSSDAPDGHHRDDASLYDDDDDDDDEDHDDDEDDDDEDDEAGRGEWARAALRSSGERRGGAQAAPVAAPSPTPALAPDAGCTRLAESTPDLVLDLPAQRARDQADTFAHNRDTLRRRPAHRHTASAPEPCPAPAPAGPAAPAPTGPAAPAPPAPAGSPVPARNTARVAAKFAELTLTGGSLKPALAAKPALLRRPTPHPHARPAAPPALPALSAATQPALPAATQPAPAPAAAPSPAPGVND